MQVTILGSGTSVPHPERASSAHWVQTSGGSLLLDMSAAAPHRMAEEKLDWVNLDAIWISHFHLDHIGGVSPFLFGTKYAPQTQSRRKQLTIFGGDGLEQLLRRFDEANDYKLFKQPFPIEIREVGPDVEFEILPGIQAKTMATPHTTESLALRITDDAGRSIVYTSDTGYSEALAAFALNADLLLMECSFFRDKPVEKHLELREAMRLAELSYAKKVILTHLYPEWDGIDLAAEARKLWGGETVEARDGLRVEV
jgi:ribonuclease BN (tRNA processing enzyme)